jgi:dephospho-CoA kinase
MSDIADIVVIGLTGQSGAGKTTVCKVFEENGFTVIDADLIARNIMYIDSPCLNEVTECFGKTILNPDKSLNRQKMADIIFSDKEKLYQYNAICYPYITYEILSMIKAYAEKDIKFILLDAPTLFESRADDFCDLIISVISNEKNRLARIIQRDNLPEEKILQRFSSQHTERFFVTHSDVVLKNNKTVEALIEKAKEVSEKIKEYYNAEKPRSSFTCYITNHNDVGNV